MTMPRHLRERIGRSKGRRPLTLVSARFLLHAHFTVVETRLLILNADPVFQDKSLAIFDQIDEVETHIARTLSEAVSILLGENFDAFVVEGETTLAVEQATNSPRSTSCAWCRRWAKAEGAAAGQQNIALIVSRQSERRLTRVLKSFVRSLEKRSGTLAEGSIPAIRSLAI